MHFVKKKITFSAIYNSNERTQRTYIPRPLHNSFLPHKSPPISSCPDVSSELQTTRFSERTVTSWTCTTSTAADMNAKFVFAVFLALQVSLTLCEIPAPDQELVDKYNDLKNTFQKRIVNAYSKLMKAAEPYVEQASANENAQAAKEAFENLQNKPELAKFQNVMASIGEEVSPMVDRARTALLGLYGHYVRPHIGEYLNDGINRIKVVLDEVMPVEN